MSVYSCLLHFTSFFDYISHQKVHPFIYRSSTPFNVTCTPLYIWCNIDRNFGVCPILLNFAHFLDFHAPISQNCIILFQIFVAKPLKYIPYFRFAHSDQFECLDISSHNFSRFSFFRYSRFPQNTFSNLPRHLKASLHFAQAKS